MGWPVRRSVCALVAGVLAATTATITGGSAAQADSGTVAGSTVRVRITKYHNIKMVQHLRPGVHRFVVRSTKQASFQIIRPHAGYTKREAARDGNAIFNSPRALKRFERNVTLLGGVTSQPGHPGVMWARVPAGRTWVVDTNSQKLRARKITSLVVSGERVRGVLPGRATLRAVDETQWAKLPRSIPHRGRLIFRNNSVDNHFVDLFKLAPGKTVADFRQWVQDAMNGADAPPPLDFSAGIDTGVVGPGHAMSQRYNLPPGDYVLSCFWPDAENDNMPHAFMGMYRGITLR